MTPSINITVSSTITVNLTVPQMPMQSYMLIWKKRKTVSVSLKIPATKPRLCSARI